MIGFERFKKNKLGSFFIPGLQIDFFPIYRLRLVIGVIKKVDFSYLWDMGFPGMLRLRKHEGL